MSTIRKLLQEVEKKYSQNAALSIGKTEYSYQVVFSELVTQLDLLQERISSHRVVSVLADKTLDGYRAVAGAFLSGKTYVPLNAKYPGSRNIAILEQSMATMLFVEASERDKALALNNEIGGYLDVVVFGHEKGGALVIDFISAEQNRFDDSDELANDGLAYLLFTSGSTGQPKGVPISFDNLNAYLENIKNVFEFSESDRFSQFFDFTFDLSVHDILVCWMNGACLCPPDKSAMLLPLHFAERAQLTVWFSVPSLALAAKDLLGDKFNKFRLSSVRCSLFCGEALPQTLAKDWKSIVQGPLINLYGPTEATIAFTAHEYTALDDGFNVVPIGRAFGSNQVMILDATGSCAPKAELCLAGAQVFQGYWQRPDLSADAFHNAKPTDTVIADRYYRSGDLVSRNGSSVLIYHGRRDRQVQVGGFRVELQEVEHTLRSITNLGELGVIAHPVTEVGEAKGLIAFIGDTELDTDVVQANCKEHLPSYMVPNKIISMTQLPYNANGKLDYNKLREFANQEKNDCERS